ncbi:hypothetical protein OA530_04280 [Pelagibacteraceae bacterium]|nr:hypothetical protein [Pelagibacteraceae bacterium]
MEFFLIFYFVINFVIILLILRSQLVYSIFTEQNIGAQKIHSHKVARSGGLVFILMFFIYFIYPDIDKKVLLYFYIFLIIGLIEDSLKNINPNYRFMAIMIFSFLCIFDQNLLVNQLDIKFIDIFYANSFLLQFFFTSIALSVAINAYNLIDGFNGLLLGIAIIGIIFILYSLKGNYFETNYYFLICALITIFSLFLFNFPNGKLFTGDGGAYVIGFLIGYYSIKTYNDLNISAWYFAVILCYPMMELAISFIRRLFFMNKQAFSADLMHLHSLLFMNLKNKNNFLSRYANPFTSVIIWLFYLVQVSPLLFIINNSFYLKVNFIFSVLFYLLFYFFIVGKFNSIKY